MKPGAAWAVTAMSATGLVTLTGEVSDRAPRPADRCLVAMKLLRIVNDVKLPKAGK